MLHYLLFLQLTPLGICQILLIKQFSFKEVNQNTKPVLILASFVTKFSWWNLLVCFYQQPDLDMKLQAEFWSKSWSQGTRNSAPDAKQTWALLVASQVQHLLLSSIQCQYSLINVFAFAAVTAQLPLCCLPALLSTAQNRLVFIQTEVFN